MSTCSSSARGVTPYVSLLRTCGSRDMAMERVNFERLWVGSSLEAKPASSSFRRDDHVWWDGEPWDPPRSRSNDFCTCAQNAPVLQVMKAPESRPFKSFITPTYSPGPATSSPIPWILKLQFEFPGMSFAPWNFRTVYKRIYASPFPSFTFVAFMSLLYRLWGDKTTLVIRVEIGKEGGLEWRD